MADQLTPELQRAEAIADVLYKAVATAKRCRQERVSIRTAQAEELLQLLEDSLKTAKQILHQGGSDEPRKSLSARRIAVMKSYGTR